MLSAANQPHLTEDQQRSAFEQARRIGDLDPRPSAYDKVPEERRHLIIGLAIRAGGDAWCQAHPKQMDWLRRKGITPAEAVQAHLDWEHERHQEPLWQELINPRKSPDAG